jgi:hypothetical protein
MNLNKSGINVRIFYNIYIVLICLSKHKNEFNEKERESLICKYVSVALNGLYKIYTEENGQSIMDEENRGKAIEEKLK